MSKSAVDLLMHPVRIRIVNALAGGRTLTTAELCDQLPDASQATVYRHVAALTEGGILEVDGEQPVRGTLERRYRLHRQQAAIDASVGQVMSADEHQRLFTASMAALIAEFDRYLQRDGANPYDDAVSYRQTVVWLSDEELASMIREFQRLLAMRGSGEPAPGRSPYMLSTILFPAAGGETSA
jgi:DNA-binding transcriptional ArsR family regulator